MTCGSPIVLACRDQCATLPAIAAVGLVGVPAGSAFSPTSRHCVKLNLEPLQAGRDYQVFPDDLDATMQSLQAAITRRDSQPVFAIVRSTAPVEYVVVPDDLDATMQSLQGALAERQIAQNGSAKLV